MDSINNNNNSNATDLNINSLHSEPNNDQIINVYNPPDDNNIIIDASYDTNNNNQLKSNKYKPVTKGLPFDTSYFKDQNNYDAIILGQEVAQKDYGDNCTVGEKVLIAVPLNLPDEIVPIYLRDFTLQQLGVFALTLSVPNAHH
jgi:hypothetical protein